MNVNQIVAELEEERDRLDVAIAALQGAGGSTRRRGRPAGISKGRGRRRMSAAARRRISEGMKARWAARKKKTSAA